MEKIKRGVCYVIYLLFNPLLVVPNSIESHKHFILYQGRDKNEKKMDRRILKFNFDVYAHK